MQDYFEIDFLDVESDKSGDAIPLRYRVADQTYIHIVDGGYQATGPSVVKHVEDFFDKPTRIDHVVATHPDGDHAGGLRTVLEHFDVGTLWMIRPWLYADEIIHRFETYSSPDALKSRLKKIYPNLAALEEIALGRNIQISDPFQGAMIGAFTVLAPTKARYLDLLVESERTPEEVSTDQASIAASLGEAFASVMKAAANLVRAAWGDEVFSTSETSNENEMSVVQFARIAGKKIVLTADAGRGALREAADYAPFAGLALPGVDRFQVPHHGSRRNVSSTLLDEWLGPKLPEGHGQQPHFTAIISSAKADVHHPRKSVVRAMMHRGATTVATEGNTISTGHNQPDRLGWSAVKPCEYPLDQEE